MVVPLGVAGPVHATLAEILMTSFVPEQLESYKRNNYRATSQYKAYERASSLWQF